MKRTWYTWTELAKTLKSHIDSIYSKFDCNGNIVSFTQLCNIIKDSASYDIEGSAVHNDFYDFIETSGKETIKLIIEYRPRTKDFEILIGAETECGAGCSQLFISTKPTTKQYINAIQNVTAQQLRATFY